MVILHGTHGLLDCDKIYIKKQFHPGFCFCTWISLRKCTNPLWRLRNEIETWLLISFFLRRWWLSSDGNIYSHFHNIFTIFLNLFQNILTVFPQYSHNICSVSMSEISTLMALISAPLRSCNQSAPNWIWEVVLVESK